MQHRNRWLVGAALVLAPLACADEPGDDLSEDRETAEAIEEQSSLEAPPDESATGAGLAVGERAGLGTYLIDRDGRAVYLFTADEGQEGSSCYDECAEVWPPMIAENGEQVGALGSRVRPDLIGTIERRDGQLQVTYGGHPLYLYSEDAGAGEITGQDMQTHGGEWYLVTPEGRAREGGSEEAGG